MSKLDSVSKAIHQMQESIMHLSDQHTENTWVQDGKMRVAEILRGEKNTDLLAYEIITFFFDYFSCQMGTFYTITPDNQLGLTFSMGNQQPAPDILSRDSSLVGQAIQRKKPIVINSVSNEFFKVSTTLGASTSVSVFVIPLYYNQKLVGLMELAKLTPYTPIEVKFIEEAAESIGIFLNTILGKIELEKLLVDLDAKEQELQNRINAINKSNMVIEFDFYGNILDANLLFLDKMGYDLDEIKSQHHKKLVPPDVDYDIEFSDFWAGLREGKSISGEFRRVTKQNDFIWIQASYNPVSDKTGKVYKIIKIGYDITEMKNQRQEIENMTLKLNQQVAAVNKAAIVSETDADGNIIYVNDLFCEISEYTREELIGKNHRILKSGKQPEGIFKGLWKAISMGLTWQGEILNVSKTGKYYWVESTIMPFKDHTGKIEKFVAVRFDITKQKESEALKRQTEALLAAQRDLEESNTELEAQTQKLQASEEELRVQQEELMQSNKELEEKTKLLEEKNHAFDEKNKMLIEAGKDLQRKSEELALSSKYKSEFLANMSHELRTPLNSIILLSKLLKDNLEENLSADQIEYVSVVHKAGNNLLELINEILDLSKIESGKMDINPEKISLDEFKKDTNDLFLPLSKEKEIDFSINVSADCPKEIFTDRLRIDQVIKNLLSNAFKFSAKGKVNLNISMHNSKQIIFAVADTGIGIPKEKQALVFEAFQQADGSTKRKYGGTGLGLSISREIAHLLGGSIHLESEPGKGSTFSITIPINYNEKDSAKENNDVINSSVVSEDEKEVVIIEDDRNNLNATDKSILIIEDDEVTAKVVQQAARQRGYKTIVALDGKQGVNFAKNYIPSGIILDINLPIKNGWDVLKELKNFAETKNIPVHILSSEDIDKNKSKIAGAIDFTSKPVNDERLEKVFNSLNDLFSGKSGKVLLFSDVEEHRLSLENFLNEKELEVISLEPESELSLAPLKEDTTAILIDLDFKKGKVSKFLEKIKPHFGGNSIPVIIFCNTYLSSLDQKRIHQFDDSFIIKIVKNYSGIVDEIGLFLNYVNNGNSTKTIKPAVIPAKLLENKKILVVDDDEQNRFSISKLLETNKANVIQAVNGKNALEVWKVNPDIDVVLMDIMMPEMDGYEATAELRKLKGGDKVPIIALTGKTQADERERCIKCGCSDYLTKPIDADFLLSLIRIWLMNKESKN
jgi:PAS domain S-box-containing protein